MRPNVARKRVRGAVAACAALLLFGCGHGESPEPRVPPTDRDPLPYAPLPQAEGDVSLGSESAPVALAAGEGHHQAVNLVSRFIRSVCDMDQETLAQLLSADLARAGARIGPVSVSRDATIAGLLRSPHRRQGNIPIPTEDLIDVSGVTSLRLGDHLSGQPVPSGLLESDVLVRVPLTQQGTAELAFLGWGQRGFLIIREGSRPEIIGY